MIPNRCLVFTATLKITYQGPICESQGSPDQRDSTLLVLNSICLSCTLLRQLGILFSLRYKNKTSFAVHYVKNGPKVDSTIEPQYETCAEVKITESDYTAYNVTGEQITLTCFDIMLPLCKFICAKKNIVSNYLNFPVNIIIMCLLWDNVQ